MANRAKNVFSLRAVLQAGVGLCGPLDVDITFPKQCVLGKGTAAPGLCALEDFLTANSR